MLLKPVAAIALLLAAAGCGEGERAAPEAASKAAPEAAPDAEAPPVGAGLGEKIFGQCAICHSAAAPGSPTARTGLIGPSLWGIVGRPSASLEGYDYSDAMRSTNLVWDEETLSAYLENPQKFLPGNRMSFAGERDPERRRVLIEYLKTLN